MVKIPTRDLVHTYFSHLAPIWSLTPKEVDILTLMYKLDPAQPTRHGIKERLVKDLGFKSTATLNNYISDFRKRGILHKEKAKMYRFHPAFKQAGDGTKPVKLEFMFTPK